MVDKFGMIFTIVELLRFRGVGRKRQQFPWVALVICLSFNSSKGLTQDNRSAVLARMTVSTVVKIPYREIRNIDLLDEPWIGNGFFYVRPPNTLIKHQIKPGNVVLAAKGERMWFHDVSNKLRHDSAITKDEPIGMMVSVFQAIVNGDQQHLLGNYNDDFISSKAGWELNLQPKADSNLVGISRITLSGTSENKVDTFIVLQSDGDSTVFKLGKIEATGSQLEKEIDKLISLAEGD